MHTSPIAAALAAAEAAGQLDSEPGGSDNSAPTAAPLQTTIVRLIYKHGDDLRQDQLVVQMISLMDRHGGRGTARGAYGGCYALTCAA